MEPIIELTSSLGTVTLTGTDVANGYIYDNAALRSWLKLADVDVALNKRPNAHGTYAPDQLFAGEKRWSLPGRYFGESILEATIARNTLAALYADGRPILATVTDAIGPTSRAVFVVDFDPEWMPDGNFKFELALAAPDPRRYGPLREPATGLATPSSGLVWPLNSGSGYWDWGTPGSEGRLTFTNAGNTTTYPVLLVGEDGDMPDGFEVVEVTTGRTITYPVATGGGIVRIDNRTHRATVNGGDVTGNLTRKEWFEVPPGASCEYQFVTLGPTTGAPELTLLAADAYL